MTSTRPDPLHRADPAEDRAGHWMSGAKDAAMQQEHGFLWDGLLRTAGEDLNGLEVLDAGCNQGGFLRLVADRFAIARGSGYDPAAAAVAEARRLAGDRPLRYEVADTVPPGWDGFDVAFSHEVLYLLHDLDAHAKAIHAALVPDGRYYVAFGMHDRNPLAARVHRELSRSLDLPPIYSLEEVAAVFADAGFDVGLTRFQLGFMPAAGHEDPDLATWLRYYHEDKILLRFTRR
jgi:SAM-dependent methyltransferase